MARKQATSAEVTPEISPEVLQAPEMAPDELAHGVAIVRHQSDVKDAAETPSAHPMPPGPDEYEEVDRMLASAESIDEKKAFVRRKFAKQKSLGDTEGRRDMFWSMESLTLPRASIIARYLHDERIDENRKHVQVDEQVLYGDISKHAPHHLSEAAEKHVKCAQSPANPRESRAAASYFIKNLKPRVQLLVTSRFLERDGDRFWLNDLGARVFKRWPWWSSRDDDDEPRLESEPLHPPKPGERKPS